MCCICGPNSVFSCPFLLIIFHPFPGSYELQVPENHKVHEKVGTLELEDRDQIQNKEPIFSLPEDISKLFSVQRSPTKDANLMLNKVGRKKKKKNRTAGINKM